MNKMLKFDGIVGNIYFLFISICNYWVFNMTSSVLTHVGVLTYLNFDRNIRSSDYYFPHFTDEEVQEQGDEVMFHDFIAAVAERVWFHTHTPQG